MNRIILGFDWADREEDTEYHLPNFGRLAR